MKLTKQMKLHLLKVISLIFSFFLWIYILGSATTKIEFQSQLTYILPKNVALKGQYIGMIDIEVEGPQVVVRDLPGKWGKIEIDLSRKITSRTRKLDLHFRDLGLELPFAVKLLRSSIDQIKLTFSKKIKRKLPVAVPMQGKVPVGLQLISSKITPHSIWVEGAPEVLNKLKKIETQKVDLGTLTQSGVRELELAQEDLRLQYQNSPIQFKFVVKAQQGNLVLKNIPITFMTRKTIKSASQRFANIVVLETADVEESFNKEDIHLFAKIPSHLQKKGSVTLEVELPKQLSLVKIDPPKIDVAVKEME